MKKILISGLVALVFTSCASIRSGKLTTEGQPSWPAKEAIFATKVGREKKTSTFSPRASNEPEIRHKEGWLHPAAR